MFVKILCTLAITVLSLSLPVSAAELPTAEPSASNMEMQTENSVPTSLEEANPYVYYDEADNGMASEYKNNMDASWNSITGAYCDVTLIASVPADISADKVMMTCYNMDTYEEYSFDLYHINDYTAHAKLPYGDYYIYTGGFYGDATGMFPIEKKVFSVADGANVITFTIGENGVNKYLETETVQEIESESEISDITEEITEAEEEEFEESTMEEVKETNSGKIISIILSFILWIGFAGVFFLFYIRKIKDN